MSAYADTPAGYDVASLKTPPYSLEAEQSVIGGILLKPAAFDSVAELLSAEDFYRPEHQAIFRQMIRLVDAGQPIDPLVVSEAMSSDLDCVGGGFYLMDLAQNTPSASNVMAYARSVKERAVLRGLILAGQRIADSGFEPGERTPAELVDEAQSIVLAMGESAQGEADLHCAPRLKNLVEEWQRRADADGLVGLSTGFDALDSRTSGLGAGDLIIVAGRPGSGKTTLSMNIAENVAVRQGKAALVFSMEMTAEQLLDRSAASIGGIPYELIRTGQVFEHEEHSLKPGPTVQLLKSAPLYIDDRPALTVQQMRATARKLHKRTPLSLVVVDYLQLARSKAESRVMEITQISQGLKALAKELRVPVIALSQLSRKCEEQKRKPIASDLRDSGSIEQDADLIWLIYRDEVYNPKSPYKGVAEIICGKQRNGPTGEDLLQSDLGRCRFTPLERGWKPEECDQSQARGEFTY